MEEPTEASVPEAPTAPDEATMALALRIAEAVIFAADRPVSPQTLATVLPEGVSATMACAALAEAYQGRGVVLTEIGGGYAFRTAADLAPRLTKVVESPRRLPRAAMEALAIIAYHQPCTRGDVEDTPTDPRGLIAVRGFDVGADGLPDTTLGRYTITS
jgi:segregation and condensation protein B